MGNDGGEARSGAHELSDDDVSDGGFNEVLADAIFKRPASIRVRSSSRSLRSAFEADKSTSTKGGSAGTSPGAQVSDEVEHSTEFAFPSLTDMGNIIYQSSVKSTNGTSNGNSRPSSQSQSPTLDTSDVALELPEETSASTDAEEERLHSLPPVIEQPEDAEGHPEAHFVEGAIPLNDRMTPTEGSDITPRKEHPLGSQLSTSEEFSEASAIKGEGESEDSDSVDL